MVIKKYDYLHSDIVFIRTEVFVKEQEFEEEFDTIDNDCTFFVMYDGDKPIATCRYFVCEDDSEGYHIGRIAVMKEYRGKGLMIGLELNDEYVGLRDRLLFEKHFFTGAAGAKVIRLLPSLTVSMETAESFVKAWKELTL
jgi:GNAT superfamily N-acetyltransferase